MLGIIHRTVLGQGPPHFEKFFVLADAPRHPDGRITLKAHDRQLRTYRSGRFLQTTAHSLLGAIDVYNLLPQYVIAACDVGTFQNRLQQILKAAASETVHNWSSLLCNRHLVFMHPLLNFTKFEGPICKVGNDGNDGDMGVNTDGAYSCVQGWLKFAQ